MDLVARINGVGVLGEGASHEQLLRELLRAHVSLVLASSGVHVSLHVQSVELASTGNLRCHGPGLVSILQHIPWRLIADSVDGLLSIFYSELLFIFFIDKLLKFGIIILHKEICFQLKIDFVESKWLKVIIQLRVGGVHEAQDV